MMQAWSSSFPIQPNRLAGLSEYSITERAYAPPEHLFHARTLLERYLSYSGYAEVEALSHGMSISRLVWKQIRLLFACSQFLEKVFRLCEGRLSREHFLELTNYTLVSMILDADLAGQLPSLGYCRRSAVFEVSDIRLTIAQRNAWLEAMEAELAPVMEDECVTDRILVNLFGRVVTCVDDGS